MNDRESYVIDTSVAIKWIIDEEDSDKADLLQGADMAAPALPRLEAGNVLRTITTRQAISQEKARELFTLLQAAPVVIFDKDELLHAGGDYPADTSATRSCGSLTAA